MRGRTGFQKRQERNNMIDRSFVESFYTDHRSGPIGTHRFFTVLVPFVEIENELHLLFEVRAKDMASQPGEICFPGGHMEGEETPVEGAVRETFEETGLHPKDLLFLAPGDTLYGNADYTLYTSIAVIAPDALERMTLQTDEVDSVFTLPFAAFTEREPELIEGDMCTDMSHFPYEEVGIDRDYRWRTGTWMIPIYHIEERVIWGMTANIIRNMVHQLKEADHA